MHLDERQMLESLEGGESSASSRHLANCPQCREALDGLRAVLLQVSAADVPEPSPLFWTHFRSRVGQAINNPPAPTRSVGLRAGFKWLTAATAALAIVLILLVGRTAPRPTEPAATADAGGAPIMTSAADLSDSDIDSDQAWAVVRSVADDLDYETAHDAGLAPAPGSLDRAAASLTAPEQAALVALLQEEMKRTDS